MRIKIYKKAKGASGYEIILSKNKTLKKGNKRVSISGTSKTLTGLTSELDIL